jgi:hypothetical protein
MSLLGTRRLRFDSYAARKHALGELAQVRDAAGEDPEALDERRTWDEWEDWVRTTPPPPPPQRRRP